jgi:signal transduction histidine kinase
MWIFALLAYYLKQIDTFSLGGISFSILYLVLINPPTLWFLKGIRRKKFITVLSLSIHALEIIGYSAIYYFAGGQARGYITLLYPALITYAGVMSPRSWPFIISAYCSLCLFGILLLEYLHVIPDTSLTLRVNVPYLYQMIDIFIMSALFLVVAFISSYTSGIIRRGRERLNAQNADLKKANESMEMARHNLAEKNLALEKAMEKVQASDRMKSEFLANMGHEFRTPLNHIIGFSEMLSDRVFGELNPAQEEPLQDILQSSRHLLSLINDILDLSKVEAGMMELECSQILLQELVNNSLNMVKEEASQHRLNLSAEISDQPETIQADERKLRRILYNLLSNAVRFTPDGGAVRVRVGSENRQARALRFSVIDSGIGLEATDLERIFLAFEQADNSASRLYQGTGLGLALTKKMVELHGGRIWAESEGKGKGSAFHFILPIVEA